MDLIRRVIKSALVIAVFAVVINDGYRYVGSTYEIGNVTREAAARSVAEMKPAAGDRGRVWQAGETYAQSHGATVYGFDMTENQVHIWTRMPVKGTWVVQRVMALLEGKPQNTPLLVEDETSLVIPPS